MRDFVLTLCFVCVFGCSSNNENNFIEAIDDHVSSVQNFERTFKKLLFNDSFGGNIILSVDGTTREGGKVVVNNRHIVYTPATDFIGEDQFKKSRIHDFDWLEGGWFSIKDINIYKDQIYISYTREVEENCWNTSLLHGKMNFKLTIFENLFTSDECVHFYDNIDGEFNANQSGGRIINVDDQNGNFIGEYQIQFQLILIKMV